MSKYRLKKDANELQEYLQFRRRGSRVESVKGKGSKYKRSREKDKARKQEEEWYRGRSVRVTHDIWDVVLRFESDVFYQTSDT